MVNQLQIVFGDTGEHIVEPVPKEFILINSVVLLHPVYDQRLFVVGVMMMVMK